MDPPSFLSELKRRKVYRVAVVYAIVAWLCSSAVRPVYCAGSELVVLVFEVCPFASRRSSSVRLTPGRVVCLIRLRSATVAVTRALETPEHALVPASLGLGQQDAGATLRFAS
jgi:hypothetical protein